MTHTEEPRRVSVNVCAAIALAATVAGMLLGYEVARVDRDIELGRLWTRKEADDGRSG